MQISSPPAQPSPLGRSAPTYLSTSEIDAPPVDFALLDMAPDQFADLVNEAKAMPEVRDDVVRAYRARIRSGHYPSYDIVAGLTHLIGDLIAQGPSSDES